MGDEGGRPDEGRHVSTARRRLLLIVLGSIAVNAALGVYAILAPHFGDLQGRVLGTSACATGAGVMTFACLPALEQGRARYLPLAGIAATLVAFALLVVGIWAGGGDTFGETIGSVFVVAGVGVLGSVLSLARLAPRFRWVLTAALALTCILGVLLLAGIWGDTSGSWGKAVGVVAVLLAAAVLSVPILHRASRAELPATSETGPIEFCPSCGTRLAAPASKEAACAACGASFRVDYLPAGVGDGASVA
jgi:hypothetical protein